MYECLYINMEVWNDTETVEVNLDALWVEKQSNIFIV